MPQPYQRRNNLPRPRATQPHHANPAPPHRRRDRHNRLLFYAAHVVQFAPQKVCHASLLTYNVIRYILCVIIQSFQCAETHSLFITRKSRKWNNLLSIALRKLDQLNAAAGLTDIAVPQGNRLELLKGSRKGQHSIRINDQWRICFLWTPEGAHHVEIVDYL